MSESVSRYIKTISQATTSPHCCVLKTTVCVCVCVCGQVESKPGRAVVTFLLVCNLALWVVTLFEIRKTIVVPFHLGFYGILPWNIILHLCVPLYIYFRFHSAICLSKIWFNAYQKGDRFL